MAILKCKMCGGDIQAAEGQSYGTCEYCGSTMTLPQVNDSRMENLFNRANHFRMICEFDRAMATYELILNEDNSSAEAHWGMLISRHGIEYVEDPASKKRIPTCHRIQQTPIQSDDDYTAALQYAPDGYTRSLYEAEGARLAELQRDMLQVSAREEPYDIFICYKESDSAGNRTMDSALAADIYHQLTAEGYRVFFSRISLEKVLGEQYEPYIFAALNSAKVMLVIGTQPEYFNAVWVKNEWSRFLALRRRDRQKLLIPCYRDMNVYDLPDELSMLQCQDMGRIGFIQDLLHGVEKVLGREKPVEAPKPVQPAPPPPPAPAPAIVHAPAAPVAIEPLYRRAMLFLEDGDFAQADKYLNRVLDQNPEYAPAYIGRLMHSLNLRTVDELTRAKSSYEDNPHWKKALRFATPEQKAEYEAYAAAARSGREELRQLNIYNNACRVLSTANDEQKCREAWNLFSSIADFRDAREKMAECKERPLLMKYKTANARLNAAKQSEECTEIAALFEALGDFRDAPQKVKACHKKARQLDYEAAAAALEKAKTTEDCLKAQKLFEALGDYSDSRQKAVECYERSREIEYDHAATLMNDARSRRQCLDAAEAFDAMGGYKDSVEKAEACRSRAAELLEQAYQEALKQLDAANNEFTYRSAISAFERLEGYRDSAKHIAYAKEKADAIALAEKQRQEREAAIRKAKMIKTAKISAVIAVILVIAIGIPATKNMRTYNRGEKLLRKGKYDQAAEVFIGLDDYKDSEKMVTECTYQKGIALMEDGEYDAARDIFKGIRNYSDSEDMIDECWYREGKQLMKNGEYDAARDIFKGIRNYSDSEDMINECWYRQAKDLMAEGNTEEALRIFETIPDYKDSDECIGAYWYQEGKELLNAGQINKAVPAFCKAGNYENAPSLVFSLAKDCVAVSYFHTVGLKADGRVVAVGEDDYGSGWSDIVAVATGALHTVGLKEDGTVVVVGNNRFGQCNVKGWTDIVAVTAGDYHTVGLKADGSVVAVGHNGTGQCDVSGWTDIVAVSAAYHTMGLKADGTVVAVGYNDYGQCDVSGWTDIVAVAAGECHSVGLKADGTVVVVGSNKYGQCDVSGWTDIVAVTAGDYHTVGLKADGTVVAVGVNDDGRCDVSGWSDIVAVAAGTFNTVGLKEDGTVVAVGNNDEGQCNVSDWDLW